MIGADDIAGCLIFVYGGDRIGSVPSLHPSQCPLSGPNCDGRALRMHSDPFLRACGCVGLRIVANLLRRGIRKISG